jgi:hypothetical protein
VTVGPVERKVKPIGKKRIILPASYHPRSVRLHPVASAPNVAETSWPPAIQALYGEWLSAGLGDDIIG